MTSNKGYSECLYLWENLPDSFKKRWSREAKAHSMTGFNLFMKTNLTKLKSGGEFTIAPWF
ncbi:MAG TPA: hypothetical protein PK986_03930 [Spirochaetota bacterium]|nr:hypothetical protein [Spirochaetota bacterium]HQO39597.1 hypothetical protein [Spirochaetota bacterium]